MKSSFDRLNLKPAERRLVVGVGAMLFFVLNLWFVFPHFSDLSKVQFRIAKARKTKALFEGEIAQVPVYQGRLRQLESENFGIPTEEQNLHFANTREGVAAQSGVIINQTQRIQSRTNQFFVELTQQISLNSKEQQLVDFLYNLGSGNSMIRVRDLSLRPDPARQQLAANIKLAASYQKKAAPKPAAATQLTATPPPRTNPALTATPPPRTNPPPAPAAAGVSEKKAVKTPAAKTSPPSNTSKSSPRKT
jgi:Tfp pilus assembly protein PilO